MRSLHGSVLRGSSPDVSDINRHLHVHGSISLMVNRYWDHLSCGIYIASTFALECTCNLPLV